MSIIIFVAFLEIKFSLDSIFIVFKKRADELKLTMLFVIYLFVLALDKKELH